MKNGKTPSPSENVSISIQGSVLNRLDKYCQQRDLTRSQVVSRAVKMLLASEMAKDPCFWDAVYDRFGADGKL